MNIDDMLAVSVLGPAGLVDLAVPMAIDPAEVAAEYGRQTGVRVPVHVTTTTGEALTPGRSLAEAGVVSGDLLVVGGLAEGADDSSRATEAASTGPGPGAAIWGAVAAGFAVLAGLYAATLPSGLPATLTIVLLAVAAVLGVLPIGRFLPVRTATAPAFAAAAAYAAVASPDPSTGPMTWGIAGLTAAATAAAGRTLLPDIDDGRTVTRRDEIHLVWIVAGLSVFAVAGLSALAGFGAPVAWALLLIAAMLAARVAPHQAVDVPDHLLVDFERLAASAWSAREQPTGRRGRMVIAGAMVSQVVERGQRLIAAASAAVAVVAVVAAGHLLFSGLPSLDRIGAAAQSFFVGACLLFAASSYRNVFPRVLLRMAGLGVWGLLFGSSVGSWSGGMRAWVIVLAVIVGLGLVVAAVAAGRGWRSVYWARRAEVGEALCGAFAVAAVCVTSGLFRTVWELTSR